MGSSSREEAASENNPQTILYSDSAPVSRSRPHQAEVSVQLLSKMELGLPMSDAHLHWDFHRDVSQDLDKAEK